MRTIALVLLLAGAAAPMQSPDSAPALADPPGITSTVTVSTVAQLQSAIAGLVSNRKIVITPGTYTLSSQLWIPGPVSNVVIRGATGNRADVVIQGAGMTNPAVPHGFELGNVTNALIADLSVGSVFYHPFQLHGEMGCDSPRIYNCRIFDAGEQLVKGTWNGTPGTGVDGGRVEYCVLEYTTTAPSDYTNGVDIHNGANWQIRHSTFRNIRAPAGQPLAGPAILLWNGCSNTLTEGCTFLNCERGISYGLIDNSGAIPNDHVGGIIRNNMIHRSASQSGDVGIYVADCPNAQVLNNTILLSGTYGTPIEYRFAQTTNCAIANNLLDGTIWARDGASGTLTTNVTGANASMFAGASTGDLHLVAGASPIDQGTTVAGAVDDWDGGARPSGAAYDVGADEYGAWGGPPPPPPPGGGGGGGGHGGGCGACGGVGSLWPLAALLVLAAFAMRR